MSKLTGVSCHSLRVWERRYGLMAPQRLASGHRRYDADQVRVLRAISNLIHSGKSIGEVAQAYLAGALPLADDPGPGQGPAGANPSRLVDMLSAGDLAGGEDEFRRMSAGLSLRQSCLEVLIPALVEVGDRWFRGECALHQERCVTSFVRLKMDALLERARAYGDGAGPRRRILVGTVEGDRHGGGVVALALMLETAGCRAIDLGVDLPAAEFGEAARAWHADAIAISFILSRNINKRFSELALIRDVPVFVGGRSILNYQGLARRNGLIPLVGPLAALVARILDELDRRDATPPPAKSCRSGPPTPSNS